VLISRVAGGLEHGHLDRRNGRPQEPDGRRGRLHRARHGTGTLVLACFGALDIWDLAPARSHPDTNHMVAYDESVNYTCGAPSKGARSVLKSGEGWVFEFTGPGRVSADASPQSLTKWLESTPVAEQQLADRLRSTGALLNR